MPSDTALITETIMDADGPDAEAFARLYRVYVETETVFGTVPLEIDDADGGLTVTIHDPAAVTAGENDDIRSCGRDVSADIFGIPERLLPSADPNRDTKPGTYTERGSWE